MDKKILSRDDLALLVAYIRARGFQDPAVIAEILDHFACKVEERIQRDPQLTLEHAMRKAHDDFGIAGFRPLATMYEAQAQKKYTRIYRQQLKHTLLQLPFMLLVIVSGMLVYQAFLWASVQPEAFFPLIDILLWCTTVSVLTADVLLVRLTGGKAFFRSVLARVSRSSYNWLAAIYIGIFCANPGNHVAAHAPVIALIYSLIVVCHLVHCRACYYTVKKASAEFDVLEQAVAMA
jgi:hypothetical protein